MNRFLLLTLVTLAFATTSFAQEEDSSVFVVSLHQCDRGRLDELIDLSRERYQPILQALVDEGQILQAGVARHDWGDEYNLLTYHAAPDMSSALEGWEEMTARYDEAYPDDNLFMEVCPKHRDNFYTRRGAIRPATPAPPPGGETALAVSYFTCDYSRVGEILEDRGTREVPIVQTLVEEGAMINESVFTHLWGDEWNLVFTRTARDLPALLGAMDTFDQRFEAAHGEGPSLLDQHCSAHKDNIFRMVIVAN